MILTFEEIEKIMSGNERDDFIIKFSPEQFETIKEFNKLTIGEWDINQDPVIIPDKSKEENKPNQVGN